MNSKKVYKNRKAMFGRLNAITTTLKGMIEEPNCNLLIGAELSYLEKSINDLTKVTANKHRREVDRKGRILEDRE